VIKIKKKDPKDSNRDISNQEISDTVNQQGMNPGSPIAPTPEDNPTREFPHSSRETIPSPEEEEELINPLEGLDQVEDSLPSQKNVSSGEDILFEEAPSPDAEQTNFQSYDLQPSSSQMYPTSTDIQGLIESIIEEKWEEFMSRTGDFTLWREQVNNELIAVKQEIIRTQDRFENLQKGILGKVSEYSGGVREMNTEIKALEQVFQKILQPLTENIRELQRVTTHISSKTRPHTTPHTTTTTKRRTTRKRK